MKKLTVDAINNVVNFEIHPHGKDLNGIDYDWADSKEDIVAAVKILYQLQIMGAGKNPLRIIIRQNGKTQQKDEKIDEKCSNDGMLFLIERYDISGHYEGRENHGDGNYIYGNYDIFRTNSVITAALEITSAIHKAHQDNYDDHYIHITNVIFSIIKNGKP